MNPVTSLVRTRYYKELVGALLTCICRLQVQISIEKTVHYDMDVEDSPVQMSSTVGPDHMFGDESVNKFP